MDNFEEFYHQYKKDVLNFLIYYLKTTEVDDVFQDTFIKALKAFNHNVSIENVRTWLISIARNAAIDHIRRQNKQRRNAVLVQENYINVEQRSVEEMVQMNESERALLHSINQLNKNHREVVILRGIKEFSVKETAEILNWNENTVKVTFHRAIKKLSAILNQGGVAFESQ